MENKSSFTGKHDPVSEDVVNGEKIDATLQQQFNDYIKQVDAGKVFPSDYNSYMNQMYEYDGRSNEGPLYLYGYHGLRKQALGGNTKLTSCPKDMEGTYSYKSHVACKGMLRSEAMKRYLELVPALATDPTKCGEGPEEEYGEED